MNVNAVYDVQPEMEQCSGLVFCGEHPALDLIDVIDGKRNASELSMLLVERSPCGFHVADENTLPFCDVAQLFSGFLTLSESAICTLEPLLDGFGVWIDLKTVGFTEPRFRMFHATMRIDALDDSQSTVKRFPSGRIRQMITPVFLPDRLKGVPIFRQVGSRDIFVTNLFREAVERTQPVLSGMKFVTIWHE